MFLISSQWSIIDVHQKLPVSVPLLQWKAKKSRFRCWIAFNRFLECFLRVFFFFFLKLFPIFLRQLLALFVRWIDEIKGIEWITFVFRCNVNHQNVYWESIKKCMSFKSETSEFMASPTTWRFTKWTCNNLSISLLVIATLLDNH